MEVTKTEMVNREDWNTTVHKQRKTEYLNFLDRNSEQLLEWGKLHGITPRSEKDKRYVCAEIFGRTLATKAIMETYGYSKEEVRQMPLSENYDISSPDKHFEVKFKLNDSDQFKTDDISANKEEFNRNLSTTADTELVMVFYDGTVRSYDLFSPNNKDTWDKQEKTVEDSEEITEERLKYNPTDALWTSTVTLPPWNLQL